MARHRKADLPEAELRPDPVRRRPSTLGGATYLLVLVAVIVGVVIAAAGPFRLGLWVMGVAMCVAAAARLVLPRGQAGMLGTRWKPIDVFVQGSLGTALIVLAVVIPEHFWPQY